MNKLTEKQIGKGIYYFHSNIEHKHFFGAYLNLAKDNLDQVVEEFRARLHLKEATTSSEVINNYFQDNISQTDWDNGIEILKEYLPVVRFLDLSVRHDKFKDLIEIDKEKHRRKYFKDHFNLLSKTLNDLRNYYTHFYHEKISFDGNFFKFLDEVLLEVAREVKGDRMKKDETKMALKKRLNEEFKHLVELEKKHQKSKKIKEWNDDNSNEGAVFNNAFKHILSKNRKGDAILNKNAKAKYVTDKQEEVTIELSTSGLVFFLSLFLNRKQNTQFKDYIKGYKGKIGEFDLNEVDSKKNSLRNMATHWVYSYLSFKGLKRRVKNSFAKETLLMEIVDELNKVPDEVYQTLSKTNRETFLEDINEYFKESEDNYEDAVDVNYVIRKRYDNKFNYFVIRYLDEFIQFPTLRFKVRAGYYTHDRRLKEIPGTDVKVTSNRVIKEKVVLFEKISVVNKKKSDFFTKNPEQELGWEFFPNPSYDFIGNNIPIYIDLMKHGEAAKQVQIEINRLRKDLNSKERSKNKPSKEEILLQIFGNDNVYGAGTALLSINELPALLYDLLVKKESPETIERKIVSKIVEQFQQLKKHNAQVAATIKLPKKIKREQGIIKPKVIADLDIEIHYSKDKYDYIVQKRIELKDKINKNRNKNRNKNVRYFLLKSKEQGEEATWIAKDIVRMMPKENRKEWKSIHQNELQKQIAFYNRSHKDARERIKSFWDFQSEDVFGKVLVEAFSKDKFEDFFETYIIQRKKAFIQIKRDIENEFKTEQKEGLVHSPFFRFFDERMYVVKDMEEQKNEILTKPINLPRGIFDSKPTFISGQKISEENLEGYADWYRYTYDKTHRFQSFYHLERDYKDLLTWNLVNDVDFNTNIKNLNPDEQLEKLKLKQDLVIKKIKYQDLYLKLVVDEMYQQLFGVPLESNLKMMYDDAQERYNNLVFASNQKDRTKGDKSENILNQNYFWNKPIALSLFDGKLSEPQVKIKDVGKFRKLEQDEKIETLLSYSDKVWTKLQIDDELENLSTSYLQIRQHQFLNLIQRFEEFILGKPPLQPEEFTLRGIPSFKKYVLNGVLKKDTSLPSGEIDYIDKEVNYENEAINDYETISQLSEKVQKAFLLILLRNKFAHNQLPYKKALEIMLTFKPKKEEKTYAAYFFSLAEDIITVFKS